MKSRTFVVAALLLAIFTAVVVLVPHTVTFGFAGEEVEFVRQLTFNGYVYSNGSARIMEKGYIIGVSEKGVLYEYYLEKGMLHLVEVFSGPIYALSNGELVEVGFAHIQMEQSIEDDLQCAIFDQLMNYYGGCTTFVQTIEWYNH